MKLAVAQKMEVGGEMRRIQMLQGEVEAAKESEMKMLESLASQTKQLEQTKIELEEAKLELRNLQESMQDLESSGSSSRREHGLLGRFLERPRSLDSSQYHEDIPRLKSQLRSAIEAEENNKKAMDELAMTLKEVMTEVYQLKQELSATQSELNMVRAEAEHSETMRKTAESRLQQVSGEAARLRLEADESAAAWNAKEDGFVNCMKVSEQEITNLKRENSKLIESHRIAREENSKLRDIMKQALTEATIVKEALEIVRSENAQLKDLLEEKEEVLRAIRQDYENLKNSEAAALDSVEELKNLLTAASATDAKISVDHPGSSPFVKRAAEADQEDKDEWGAPEKTRGVAKFRSELWTSSEDDDSDVHQQRHQRQTLPQNGPRSSTGAFVEHLRGSISERMVLPERKDRTHKPLGCASDLAASSLRGLVCAGDMTNGEFDHAVRVHMDAMNTGHRTAIPSRHRKKKQILRRFGDLLRRGGLPK